MSKRKPEDMFGDVARFIDESNALIGRGEFAQLAGLDDMVRTLCEEVLTLSPDQRVQYADRMQELMTALQQLGESMTQMRDEVSKDINALSSHQKANVAYRVAEASDKKKQEE